MKDPHTLHINTITSDWLDKDLLMLHACFQLLTDCVEKENLFESRDWTYDSEHMNAKTEIEELYNWWKYRSQKEINREIDPIWTDNQYEFDNGMLIRLIKVRQYLWT